MDGNLSRSFLKANKSEGKAGDSTVDGSTTKLTLFNECRNRREECGSIPMKEGWGTANPTLCLATYDCFVDSVDGVRLTARLRRELSPLCAKRKSSFETTLLMQRKRKLVLLYLCKEKVFPVFVLLHSSFFRSLLSLA